MARLILQLVLLISLTALVWSAPHHDGTDHDHAEEATDQDKEHPILADGAKKAAVDGSASAKPARVARETPKESSEKKDAHPDAHTNEKDDSALPAHFNITEKTDTFVGGPRVLRDTEEAEKNPAFVGLGVQAPGPFLLQGQPIYTKPLSTAANSEQKSSEEKSSTTKTKRESPTFPQHTAAKQPYPTSLAHEGVHQAATHEQHEGDKTKKDKRDTQKQEHPAALAGAHPQVQPTSGKDTSASHPVALTSPQNTKPKRDTDSPKLGAPISPPPPVHTTLEDGREVSIVLPPIPGGPQGPKHKRDTSDTSNPTLGDSNHKLLASGPLSPPSAVHTTLEDGREASVVLPPVPGGPRPKRDTHDHEHDHDHVHDHKVAAPVATSLTKESIPASVHHDHAVSGVSGVAPKHKRDTKEEKPATVTKDVKSEEKSDEDKSEEKKEGHKQKRDSYNLEPKDKSHDLLPHENPESGDPKLAPPVHESEYDRHTRNTNKDEKKPEEQIKDSKEKDDSKKSDSSEEKKD